MLPDTSPAWTISSRCNTGSCVAVAPLTDGHIGIIDTKQTDSPILRVSRDDWTAFLERLKAH